MTYLLLLYSHYTQYYMYITYTSIYMYTIPLYAVGLVKYPTIKKTSDTSILLDTFLSSESRDHCPKGSIGPQVWLIKQKKHSGIVAGFRDW